MCGGYFPHGEVTAKGGPAGRQPRVMVNPKRLTAIMDRISCCHGSFQESGFGCSRY